MCFAKSLMAAWHQREARFALRYQTKLTVVRLKHQSSWRSRRRRQCLLGHRQVSRCANPLLRYTDRSGCPALTLWHDWSARLLRCLLTCTTHAFNTTLRYPRTMLITLRLATHTYDVPVFSSPLSSPAFTTPVFFVVRVFSIARWSLSVVDLDALARMALQQRHALALIVCNQH